MAIEIVSSDSYHKDVKKQLLSVGLLILKFVVNLDIQITRSNLMRYWKLIKITIKENLKHFFYLHRHFVIKQTECRVL